MLKQGPGEGAEQQLTQLAEFTLVTDTTPWFIHRVDDKAPVFKGTVPQDFRLLVFFMNQFPPST
jgi:hypothetical protein